MRFRQQIIGIESGFVGLRGCCLKVKLTISKRKKKPKPKKEPAVSITIPNHIEFRGGETGLLISDTDNVVVKFSDGATVGYPPELFTTQEGE